MVSKRLKSRALIALCSMAVLLILPNPSFAGEINYEGGEVDVYVKPGEPTQVSFPGAVSGGFKRENSSLALERQDNYLIIFAQPHLAEEGEAIIVHIDDKRTYGLRVRPATKDKQRDDAISILDFRIPEFDEETDAPTKQKPTRFAPPTVVSGLMRELVLVAEFGKRKRIAGYRRSNANSGEVLLHDGAVKVTVDEIFLGSNYWGYVVTAENLLNTTQKLNPATFRIDGTRAVSATRWELAPRPLTAEQQVANAHTSKVYIVTRAKR